MERIVGALALLVSLVPAMAEAGEFYVDPIHGSPDNDGSSSAPWRSLQEVLDRGLIESRQWETYPYREGAKLVAKNAGAPVKGGDTIYLRSGYHGELRVMGFYNAKDITVAAQAGHEPRFRSVLVRSGSHWVFRGLHVSPEFAPGYEKTLLFNLDSSASDGPIQDVVVEKCRLQSIEDSSRWTAAEWDALSCDGFEAQGRHITIRDNVLRNVNFGISVGAEDSLVEGNLVENFAGDGLRGFGDHSTFQYNTVKNCYAVNDNHDDGFQSWSSGSGGVGTGEVVGIVLRGNTFINYEDPDQPHRGPLQGIGCFDGTFVDWVVENNVIIVDHWHGITLLGVRNSRIVNNTVLDPNGREPGPPWIEIGPHKNGTPSSGSLVRNNLTTAISIDQKQGIIEDHNLIIKNAAEIFVDPAGYDLHLKKKSRAVDSGSADMAPEIDLDKVRRPWGGGYDIGAYEYHEGEVAPDLADAKDSASEDGKAESPGPSEPTGEAAAEKPDEKAPIQMSAATEESPNGVWRSESLALGNAGKWLLALALLSLFGIYWLMRR